MKKIYTFVAVLLIFSSCRVSISTTGGSVSPNSKTFSVADFDNVAPFANSSTAPLFTKKLKSYMQSNTPLSMVRSDGNLSFEGKITGYSSATISASGSSTDLKADKNRFTLTIQVTFINEQNPENNFEQTFSAFADFDADKSLEQVVDSLIEKVMDQIIDDVYQKAVVNW